MLQKAGAQKRRFNPLRGQGRDSGKEKGDNRHGDERHRRGIMTIAGGDQGSRTSMLRLAGIRVETSVQLRRSAQGERPEKSERQAGRHERSCNVKPGARAYICHGDELLARPLLAQAKSDYKRVPNIGVAHARGGRSPERTETNWTAPDSWITNATSQMLGPAKIYFIIFGLLTIVGGLIGYLKAGSSISLISGALAGILLLTAAWVLPSNPAVGLSIGLIVSLLLAGRFVPSFLATQKMMPAGVMAVFSLIGIFVAVLTWLKK